MAHEVDGYDLTFTGRRSWNATRCWAGKVVDVVPVTWTKGCHRAGGQRILEVWFRNKAELNEYNVRTQPFVVAIARAEDYNQEPHAFAEFKALCEVQAAGKLLSDHSIETRIIKRVRHARLRQRPK